MDSNLPAKIGKYDIIEVIGRGGMGVVYKANDPHLDRTVAIKMITSGFAENPAQLKRFFVEAKSLASLVHPNIVTVYDLGDYSGNPYLVMQYLEGEDLDSVLASRRSLSLLDKMNVIIQVCEGLSYAHRRNVVHRDIKPANIMLCSDGSIKIFDFGIAKVGDQNVTKSASQIVGTLYYMSPEQVNGVTVDGRTDLFSTGVVLYQLVTGHLPFEGESTTTTLLKITREPPPPLRNFLTVYPPELEAILLRALAKDRDDRYQSADELALDLRQLQGHLKQELIARNMEEVALLMERSDLQKARERLVQVLRIDQQNTKANQLLREVQLRIQKEEIQVQVGRLRDRAAEALAHEQFQAAQEALDRGLALDKNNTDLQRLREEVRQAMARAEKLHSALKAAETAHAEGRLDAAKVAVEEALALAPEDSQAKSLYRMIHREWVERARQQQIENYVATARQEIAARRFTAALEILHQAQTLDPDAPQVQALVDSALSGQTQERRRREIEEISRRIEEALNQDDHESACREASEGLGRFPGDRTLLRLLGIAEKQRQVAERKKFVDDQLANARKLMQEKRYEELQQSLEATLAEMGPEPRLESLLGVVQENIQQERAEQHKAECFERVNQFLQNQEYEEAAAVLEDLAKERTDDVEIGEFIERIKSEKAEMVQAAIKRAQQVSSLDLRYRILEEALTKSPHEADLQEQLDGVQWLGRLIASTANEARNLEQAGKYEESLVKWETLRSTYRHYPDLDASIERVKKLRDEAKANAREGWVGKIQSAIDASDYTLAAERLGEAEQEFQWDSDLMALRQKVESAVKLRGKAEKGIAEGQRLLASRQWEQGADAILRAMQLVPQDQQIREKGIHEFIAQAKSAVDKDWRGAEVLLSRVSELQPGNNAIAELIGRIGGLKREDSLREAISNIKSLQANGDLNAASRELAKAFAAYPDEPRLQSLKQALDEQIRVQKEKEREERERAEREAFIAGVLQRAERETSLDERIRVLEGGLKEQPSEKRIQQRLNETRELNKAASALAAEARAFERERKYDKALVKWEALRGVYRDYPDLDRSIAHVKTQQEQMLREAREKWSADIRSAMERMEYERAGNLAQQARREFPQDREFASQDEEIRQIIERRARAEKQLASAEKFAEKAKWTKAAEGFGLALEAAGTDTQVRERVFRGLVNSSRDAVTNDLEAAELLLGEAARVQPNAPEFTPIRKTIQERKQGQEVEACLKSVARLRDGGNLEGALQEIERGLSKYAGEPRLIRFQDELEAQKRKIETERLAVSKPSHRRAPTEEFQPLPKAGPIPAPIPAALTQSAKLEPPPRAALQRTVPPARAANALPVPPPMPGPSKLPAKLNMPVQAGAPIPFPDRSAKAETRIEAPRTELLKTEMLNLSDDQQVFLRAVEKELAVFLGPLARVVVKRAASKTTDIDEMFRIMAQSLARDEDRDAFLARRVELQRTAPKTQFTREIPKPATPLTSAVNPMTPLGITPEAIDLAARALAAHVGPISAVLARKAAKRADSLRSLYVLLSEHVQDGKERRRFLREAGFPDA